MTGRGEQSGTPDEIRAYIKKQKDAGADVIKIFAAASIRRPAMTLSQEQLNAACGEARKQGLRTLVHAYKDAVRAAAIAGCTQVEHGTLATDDDLKVLVQKGTWLDPQAGLVFENYVLNKEKFAGTPGFPEEVFPIIKELIPEYRDFMRRASKIPGLKIVFGSDALAGFARSKRRRIDRTRARRGNGSALRDDLRQLTRRSSTRHGRSDWFYCSWSTSRHHRPRWQSAY